MIGADQFGPDFERVLVRTCMDDLILRGLVGRFIAAGQLGWTDPGASWAWQLIRDRDHVSRLMLETEVRRLSPADPMRVGAEAVVRAAADVRDSDWVRQQVVEWARQQTFRLAWEEARQAFNAGKVDDAQRIMLGRIEEMNAMRVDVADRGWFFEEFEDRQDRRYANDAEGEVFPSGITDLDIAMNGGLHRGELEVPIAYSGIGKTFWCVQRGYIGAKLRKRVLHIPLEGGRDKTEDRYESRFTETVYREVRRGDISGDRLGLLRAEYDVLAQGLVIRGVGDMPPWTAGFDFIMGELTELRRTRGWVPDLIIVDYGDLLAEPGERELDSQKAAYRRLKGLSERVEFPGHRGYAVVSPSQAQRPLKGADEEEHVLRPRDIADCYEKVRVADIILSLNRTNAEKEAEQARVHLGKYRSDEDGGTFRVRTDYTRGGFSLLGSAEPPPPPPSIEKATKMAEKAAKDAVKRSAGGRP